MLFHNFQFHYNVNVQIKIKFYKEEEFRYIK